MAGLNHPELDRGDGACKHLTPENLCAIYEDRPDFCRLNPERPVSEQTAWCKLIEANWETYLENLRILDREARVWYTPGNEKDDG